MRRTRPPASSTLRSESLSILPADPVLVGSCCPRSPESHALRNDGQSGGLQRAILLHTLSRELSICNCAALHALHLRSPILPPTEKQYALD